VEPNETALAARVVAEIEIVHLFRRKGQTSESPFGATTERQPFDTARTTWRPIHSR